MRGAYKRLVFLILLALLSLTGVKQADALWHPGMVLGSQISPLPRKDTIEGTVVLAIEFEWFWEWGPWALGLGFPLETDFASRFAFGPQVTLEALGAFRFFTALMGEIGPPFSNFFIRAGLALGYRTTGSKNYKDIKIPAKGGFYLLAAVDYRVINPGQTPGGEWRIILGVKLHVQL